MNPKKQSALIKFPYLIKSTEVATLLTPYLWIEVQTSYNNIWRKYKFLFDTGADYTSVPRYMNVVVGQNLKNSKQEIMYTANNETMTAYLGKLKIKINNTQIYLPCAFTDRDDTPFLLGRTGLIEHFEILLSAKQKAIIIT